MTNSPILNKGSHSRQRAAGASMRGLLRLLRSPVYHSCPTAQIADPQSIWTDLHFCVIASAAPALIHARICPSPKSAL